MPQPLTLPGARTGSSGRACCRIRPHPARARHRWRAQLDGRDQGSQQEAPTRGPGAERRRTWMKERPTT